MNIANEINYIKMKQCLDRLLRKELITKTEYDKIDKINAIRLNIGIV